MKYFVLISCFIAVTYADTNKIMSELIASGKVAALECKAETGISNDEIKKLKSFDIPTTAVGKCFVFCVQKKLNFMTEDGKFIKLNGYKFLDQLKDVDAEMYEKFSNIANTCYDEVQELSDPCETATNMLICVEREKKVNGVPEIEI